MPGAHDRRPWVILSRREGLALYQRLYIHRAEDSDMGRALRVLRNQLEYIATGDGDKPDVQKAIKRERG